jgi:hypothetical protein
MLLQLLLLLLPVLDWQLLVVRHQVRTSLQAPNPILMMVVMMAVLSPVVNRVCQHSQVAILWGIPVSQSSAVVKSIGCSSSTNRTSRAFINFLVSMSSSLAVWFLPHRGCWVKSQRIEEWHSLNPYPINEKHIQSKILAVTKDQVSLIPAAAATTTIVTAATIVTTTVVIIATTVATTVATTATTSLKTGRLRHTTI